MLSLVDLSVFSLKICGTFHSSCLYLCRCCWPHCPHWSLIVPHFHLNFRLIPVTMTCHVAMTKDAYLHRIVLNPNLNNWDEKSVVVVLAQFPFFHQCNVFFMLVLSKICMKKKINAPKDHWIIACIIWKNGQKEYSQHQNNLKIKSQQKNDFVLTGRNSWYISFVIQEIVIC